jgi:DNA-binding beta-propeller fold protein YncE
MRNRMYTTGRRRLKPAATCLLFTAFCLLFLSGCATRWVMDIQPRETQLQWPNPPEKPKILQFQTIRGFREEGTSLKTVFTGRGDERLAGPVAVATGRDGRIAVAAAGCKCVHLYIPAAQQYQRISTVNDKELVSPVGVAFDDELRLYVSDSTLAGIFVFDGKGDYLLAVDKSAGAPLRRPTGLAYNKDRKLLYAADTLSHKIYALNWSGEAVFSFGERGTGNGQFNFPTHIYWSPSGQLYVTDAMNFRVQIFDSAGNFVAGFGRHGDGSGDFAMPKGIAADGDGVIYVVDSLFDNVQLFNSSGEFLLTLGGRGTAQGEFWLPSGAFIDDHDKLYVCDTYNQRVQVFQILRSVNE